MNCSRPNRLITNLVVLLAGCTANVEPLDSDTGGGFVATGGGSTMAGGGTAAATGGGTAAAGGGAATGGGGGAVIIDPDPDAGVPAWLAAIPAGRWTPVAGTEFATNATRVIPPDAYRGTSPITAIVDAYGDPSFDPIAHKLYFHGGGHGDGTCNAVVGLDLASLTYSLVGAPTPSSAYPPAYLVSAYAYPSGLALSWFHTAAQLSAPADLPFAAPVSAPVSTHQYGSQAVRAKGGVSREIHFFYAQYKVFDVAKSGWTNAHEQGGDFVSQRLAAQADAQFPGLGANIGPTVPLQQGTMTAYDALTDRFYVTAIAGDAGGGWRNFFFRYEPSTRTVSKIFRPAVPCRESMGWVIAGRWLYGVTSDDAVPYPNMVLDRGFRFNLDTEAIEYFKLTGDLVRFQQNSSQEAAPMFFNSVNQTFATWNHNVADRGALYTLSLAALGNSGGHGTAADPWLWPQARTAIAGTPPPQVAYHYNGLFYIPEWRAMVVMPHSSQPLYVIRL